MFTFKLHFLITLLLPVFITTNAQQHHSFAATKFDLSPELPAEEPIKISPQHDGKPQHSQKPQKPRKHHATKPVEAIPTSASSAHPGLLVSTGQPQQSNQTWISLRTLAPVISSPTPPAFTPLTFSTLPPLFGTIPGAFQSSHSQSPQAPTLPHFGTPLQPTGFVQQPQQTIQPSVPQQFGEFQQPQSSQQFQGFQQQNVFTNQASVGQGQTEQPNIQFVQTREERVDLWFRENYDTSICKKDSRFIANEFRLKFPINLWRNGKESLLADLLAARLEDCFTKAESGYWNRVNDLINGLSLTTTEEEECRTGLIQEQISCDNVFSYTCQFIQKAYNFRLIPTRLIIQEARYAEDGSEKCRKIVRKIKKDLQE